MTLRWVPSLSGAAPSNYRLVAGSRPGAADIADVVVGRTPELSLQVRPGQYFVRVAPIANGVTGPASAELGFNAGAAGCVTIPEPPALSFTGLPALIQWTPPTAGAQPSGFELRARVVPGALNAVRIPLPAMTTSYSTAGAPPGTYYVAVAAVNACGISGPSNEVQVVVSLPGAPAAPAALAALVGGSSVALSWTAPAGSVTGYVLEAGSAPGLADLVAGFALGPTPSFVVPGVPPGRYYVRVRAAIGALVSAPSNEIAADVP